MTPDGWRKVYLSDVAEQRTEKVIPAKADSRPYVALEHLAQGSLTLLGWSEAGTAISAKTVFRMGDVLFGKLRPYLRKAAPAPFDGLCSTDILPLFSKNSLDSRYLAQLAQSVPLQQHAVATSSGTKMPRTSWKQLAEFPFSIPPLPEQRKIAAILSSVDDAIEKTQAVIDQVQVVKRGLMQELLTRGMPGRHTRFKQTEIGEIPEEWELVRLGQIFKLTSGKGIAVRSLDENGSVENPYPVFGGNGIAGFTSCFNAEPPLLVVGRVGEYCGTVHRPVEPCWVSDNALYTRNWVRPVNVRFLGSLLQLIDLTRLRKKSGQPLVTQAPIHNLIVPLPSVPEQDEMADLLDQVDARLDAEQQKLDGLCNAKSALMSVLLTGEMRVTPDPKAA